MSQLFIDATGLNLSELSFAAAKLIFIQKRALSVSHHLHGHHQADWNEIRKTDKPTSPSVEDIGCDTSRKIDVSDVSLINAVENSKDDWAF